MQSNTTLTTPLPRRVRGTQISQAHLLLNLIAGLIAAAMLLPLAYLLLRSKGVGSRFFELLLQPRTLLVLWNSVLLAAIVTLISLVIALPLAWLTVRTDLQCRRIWSVLSVLPLVFPSYVGGYAFVAMMGPRGIVQQWLEPLGIERLPSIYGLPGAAWVLTIFTFPYLVLSIRAGLRNLDPSLEEAARNLGCGPWETFRRVTLPALRPAITAGGLLVSLYVLSDFGSVSILRYNSFTRVIYVQYQSSFDRSLAALLYLVLVDMTIVLLFSAGTIVEAQQDAAGVCSWSPMTFTGRLDFNRTCDNTPFLIGKTRGIDRAFCRTDAIVEENYTQPPPAVIELSSILILELDESLKVIKQHFRDGLGLVDGQALTYGSILATDTVGDKVAAIQMALTGATADGTEIQSQFILTYTNLFSIDVFRVGDAISWLVVVSYYGTDVLW